MNWLEGAPEMAELGPELTTARSWSRAWSAMPAGRRRELARHLHNVMIPVYYPADGMAYVKYCDFPSGKEPQESIKIPPGGRYPGEIWFVTLLLENDVWRVHGVGGAAPPQALGLAPYSW